MNGDGVSGCHVGTMPMLFAKYNVSSTSDSSVSNTIYIIRFSLIKSVYVFCRLHCDLSASYAYFRINTVINKKNYTISTS